MFPSRKEDIEQKKLRRRNFDDDNPDITDEYKDLLMEMPPITMPTLIIAKWFGEMLKDAINELVQSKLEMQMMAKISAKRSNMAPRSCFFVFVVDDTTQFFYGNTFCRLHLGIIQIDKIVIGVNSSDQLISILGQKKINEHFLLPNFSIIDKKMINPIGWKNN